MEYPLDPFKEYPLNNDTTSNNNLNEDNNNDKKLKITPFPEEHLAIFVKVCKIIDIYVLYIFLIKIFIIILFYFILNIVILKIVQYSLKGMVKIIDEAKEMEE